MPAQLSSKLLFTFLSGLSLIPTSPVQAAIEPTAKIEMSAAEILSMPEKNREAVVFSSKNAAKLGKDLMTLAFDDQQPMPIRWKALTLGSLAQGTASKENLQKALKSDAWFMRNAALVAMQRIFPSESAKSAQQLLDDKALVVRSAAVKTLASRLDADTREVLWGELDKPYNFKNKESLWIRAQILEALAKSPDKRELPIFARALRDKDSRLHHFSVLALEKISNKKLGSLHSSVAEKRNLWLKAQL